MLVGVLWAAAGAAVAAASQPTTPPALRDPDRITAGASQQFLGALSPDETQLYFVSDQQSTTQIYVEDMARGLPTLLFDELADVSWPRPSPDGKKLLYISYQTDATGDLCLRDLGPPGGKVGDRHCLTDDKSAEVQAIWLPNGNIAMVTREGLHGNFELVEISPSGTRGEVLVHGNLSTPAVSPDGKWIAYVPIERSSADIGPSFLAKAGGQLAFVSLADEKKRVVSANLSLPGGSGFPAFSRDGKWLYFTQFLNDTNLDGAIDGNDNGVLFRAAFDGGKVGVPEQLTSAGISCQYPMPSTTTLVATCQEQGTLDVYRAPLDGTVPPTWTAAQIDEEIDASPDRWEQLLLLAHRGRGPEVLKRMVRLHLELGEHESAAFYARILIATDPVIGKILVELADLRAAERILDRGELSATFVRDARARLGRLEAMNHPLAAVVASEIHDTLGEEQQARALLEKIEISDPLVESLWAERLLAYYRDDPKYFELYRPVAEKSIEHANVFVRELVRGAGPAERAQLTETWAKKVDPDSDLAFLLELEHALAPLKRENQEEVRKQVFDLYRKNKEYARRKALVDDTIKRAVTVDNEYLLYNFADTWVSYVPRERADRRRAERVYRDAVLERAYVEEQTKKTGDARGHFFGVTLQTESLESHAGFIEMRIAEGKNPADDYKGKPEGVVTRFARAYQVARGLPAVKDPLAHEQQAQAALADLALITAEAPQRAEVHALWGYIAMQRWLRGGDRLAAVEAYAHELLALDLARTRPRLRASALETLGRIQSGVGNYAIALGWLEERDKLPFASDEERLSHCLVLARARFHAGDAIAAGGEGEACVKMTEAAPLARFRPVALDRSALYSLAAGDAKTALARYTELWPLVDKPTDQTHVLEAARNRLTTQLGWAAAALAAGKYQESLDHTETAEKLVAAGGQPIGLEGAYGRDTRIASIFATDYTLVIAGLRAQAAFALGNYDEATRAMTRRRDGLAARVKKDPAAPDVLDLAGAEGQLAMYAYRQKDLAGARAHVEAGLTAWDTWSTSTDTPIEDTGLALLSAYAELHLAGVPLSELKLDLPKRLETAYNQLSKVRNPAWEKARGLVEAYLTYLNSRSAS